VLIEESPMQRGAVEGHRKRPGGRNLHREGENYLLCGAIEGLGKN